VRKTLLAVVGMGQAQPRQPLPLDLPAELSADMSMAGAVPGQVRQTQERQLMAKSGGRQKLFRCEWPDPDTGDQCGEVLHGRVQFDYHTNAHKRISPKAAKVPAPSIRRVYHVPSGDVPRLLEGETP
jgi:hypothetical protein